MRKLMYYLAAFAILSICRVDAAQITMLSSNGVREAVTELIPQFEKATGHRVMVVWDGTLNIRKRIDSGAVADLVVLPAADVDALIASGGLTRGSRISTCWRNRGSSERFDPGSDSLRPGSQSVRRWRAVRVTSVFSRSANYCT